MRRRLLIAGLAVLVASPLVAYGTPHKRLPPLPRAKPAVTAPIEQTARVDSPGRVSLPQSDASPRQVERTARLNPAERNVPATPAAPRLETRPAELPTLEDQRQHLECLRALEGTAVANLASVPAPARTDCVVSQPVSLATAGTVRLPARPLLACTFARAFARWTSSSVAALAKHHLGQPVVAVETGPGYVCRGRNGAQVGKISEHGLGNAIDIAAFTLKDGKRIPVTDPSGLDVEVGAFLAAVRATACGYFTTVLGPGADESHRDHLHIDLGQHGRSAQYRICQ